MRLVFPFAIASASALSACSSSEGLGAADASSDGLFVGSGDDAAEGGGGGDDGATPAVTVRLAQLSPDLGAIDLCYRPAGSSSWSGPIFAALRPPVDAGEPSGDDAAAAYDAGAPYDAGPPIGVPFAAMSTYVALDGSGTFDVAIVSSGSVSCATPRVLDRVTLAPSERATLVVTGTSAADAGAADAVQVLSFADEASVEGASARLRFIHAALGGVGEPPAPAFGVTLVFADQTTAAVAADLEPGHASTPSATPPVVDSYGYSELAATQSIARFVLAPAGDAGSAGAVSTSATSLSLTASSSHTAFVLDTGAGLAVLYCDDEAQGIGGATTPCTLLHTN